MKVDMTRWPERNKLVIHGFSEMNTVPVNVLRRVRTREENWNVEHVKVNICLFHVGFNYTFYTEVICDNSETIVEYDHITTDG